MKGLSIRDKNYDSYETMPNSKEEISHICPDAKRSLISKQKAVLCNTAIIPNLQGRVPFSNNFQLFYMVGFPSLTTHNYFIR